jgi:PTH1 family peptidyl-tRNA hydrolase
LKLIVGLGNPGREYASTRHNVGWWAVDHLADAWHFDGWKKDGVSLVSTGRIGEHPVRLLKPQTFMNLSGSALTAYRRRPTWEPARDLLVIVDEVALPAGSIRLRASGSAGGHNGLKSIESAVGSREYPRLRLGVGPTEPRQNIGDLADFVLAPFGRLDAQLVKDLLPRVTDACELWIREGIAPAMNAHNRPVT